MMRWLRDTLDRWALRRVRGMTNGRNERDGLFLKTLDDVVVEAWCWSLLGDHDMGRALRRHVVIREREPDDSERCCDLPDTAPTSPDLNVRCVDPEAAEPLRRHQLDVEYPK